MTALAMPLPLHPGDSPATPTLDRTSFRVLGPLECVLGGKQLEIRGTSQRALLATLLAAESRSISAGALVQELWGENPPATAENSLQAHVSRLRRKLHAAGVQDVKLVCMPSGYRLLTPQDEIDSVVFLQAIAQARTCTDDARAAELLRGALALWRGEVFGGDIGGPLCQAAAVRYDAAWTMATESLVDLELHSGQHASVVPQLTELTVTRPLNERFCEQLMVALYRSGRQTDALSVYHRMRARLDDELGVEPSPVLRRHERAILRHDDVLRPGEDHTALRLGA